MEDDTKFPSPFDFNDFPPITLVELRMRFYSGKIRSKPLWWEKVHDPAIVARWRAEIVENDRIAVEKFWGGDEQFEVGDGEKQWPRDPISDAQLDYILDEIKHEASKRDEETGIFATSIPGVYESQSLIVPALTKKLISAVSILEDVPDEEKDWHPGSDNQVLDLVHPSLYCIRIGETFVRNAAPDAGRCNAEVLTFQRYVNRRPDINHEYNRYEISRKYQWLPTDFAISDSGSSATPLGYINNLHPTRHRALYGPISAIFARFVPLFERVLGDSCADKKPLAITVDPFGWYESISSEEPRPEWPSDDYDERWEAWERKYMWPHIPDPAPFDPSACADPPRFELAGRTVQAIVKLAHIVLTPERPAYPGGAWHVEGMANERIVATGLYYYGCENISESRLAFRAAVGSGEQGVDLPYEQSDERGYLVAYGLGRDKALNQPLGHVVAEEGKCVAFPNVYQHHVDPFELADKTRPGVRKILCFFLIDPTARVLSTSDVPPQQQEWIMEEVVKAPSIGKLPVELFELIKAYTKPALISRGDAERHREALMKERAHFVKELNEEVFEMEFNMCEH